MKKFVKSSSDSISVRARNWLAGNEVDEIMKECTAREKRIIGRLANSRDPKQYLEALVDSVDILQVNISSSFDKFLQDALEIL